MDSSTKKTVIKDKLQKLLDKTTDAKSVFGSVLRVDTPLDSFCIASGDISAHDSFFIASVTKLFTASIIFCLAQTNKLSMDDTIERYFSMDEINKLDCSHEPNLLKNITIRQLLSHTSGLPDYFEQSSQGRVLSSQILQGHDQRWNFEDILSMTKTMKSKFVHGSKGKAFYSDTNYQILGQIIERVCNKSYEWALEHYIFQPLQLHKTYLYKNISDKRPINIYHKKTKLNIPMAMSSFGPDGGIVSTIDDMMIFIKAFYKGDLFSLSFIDNVEYNTLFFPIKYGLGMMHYELPRVLTAFKKLPSLIGHSGMNGSFAFYAPKIETFIVGTVNQSDNPARAFRLMSKILMLLREDN